MDQTYSHRRASPGSNRATRGVLTPHPNATNHTSLNPALPFCSQHPEAVPPSHDPFMAQIESPDSYNALYMYPESGRIGANEDQLQTGSSNDTGYGSLIGSIVNLPPSSNANPFSYPLSQYPPQLTSTSWSYPMDQPHPNSGNTNEPRQLQECFEEDPGQFCPVAGSGVEPDPPDQSRRRKRPHIATISTGSGSHHTPERLSPPAKVPRQSRRTVRRGSQFFNPGRPVSNPPAQDFRQVSGVQPGNFFDSSSLGPTPLTGVSTEQTNIISSFLLNRRNKLSFPSAQEIEALTILTEGLPYGTIEACIFHIQHSRTPDQLSAPAHPQHRLAPPPGFETASASIADPNGHLPPDVRQAIRKYVQVCNKKRARGDGRRKVNHGQYSCTADCGYHTKRAFDWRRHEETHQPQEFWLCEICRTSSSDRPFLVSRRDKLLPHIKKDHSKPEDVANEIVDNSKQNYRAGFKPLCGFCGHPFESWDSRNNHILAHFDGKLEGGVRNMSEWRDPWYEDEREDDDDDAPGDSDDPSDDQDSDYQDQDHGGPAGATGGSGNGYEYGDQQPPDNAGQEPPTGDSGFQGAQAQPYDDSLGSWFLSSSSVEVVVSNRPRVALEVGSQSLQEVLIRQSDGDEHRGALLDPARTRSNIASIPKNHLEIAQVILPAPRHDIQNSLPKPQNIGGIIGRGAYGSVDIVENRLTKQLYARKRCQLSPRNLSGLRSFQREVEIMKKLDHPHIVRLVSAYVQDSSLNIVMSPLAQCTMRQYLDLRTKQQGHTPRIHSWFGCLSSALSYLHTNRIRHADIKPQNLLIRDSDVFISDFGISRIVSEPDSTSSSISPMTPLYAALEIAERQPHGRKADIFSLGCVVVEMLTVAQGYTVAELHRSLGISSSKKRPRSHQAYYKEYKGLLAWIERLRSRAVPSTQRLWDVCKCMLDNKAPFRPSANILVEQLRLLLVSGAQESFPDCMSTPLLSSRHSTSPRLASVHGYKPTSDCHGPPQTSFPYCSPPKSNVKSLPSPQPCYISPPPTPPMIPFGAKPPYPTRDSGRSKRLRFRPSLSSGDSVKAFKSTSGDVVQGTETRSYTALKLYVTIPNAVIRVMPSNSGRVDVQIGFLVLPVVLILTTPDGASRVGPDYVASIANQVRGILDPALSHTGSMPIEHLPPRKESSRPEALQGRSVRLMDRQKCHICGRLFTAPRLTDCRKCGHIRCSSCPRLCHEILEKQRPLDQDLNEIGSHLSPPAYSLNDTAPLLEDQYVFDKIVGQNQAVEFPKEYFLQGSPSTFDLMQAPLQTCRDEWWRPEGPSPGFQEADPPHEVDPPYDADPTHGLDPPYDADPTHGLDPPLLPSETSQFSTGQRAHKRIRLGSYHIPGLEAEPVSLPSMNRRRRISVRSQQIVNIRGDRQSESPKTYASNRTIFSRFAALGKPASIPENTEPSFPTLLPMVKFASSSTDGSNVVPCLPVYHHTRSTSYDQGPPMPASKAFFLRRSLSHSHDDASNRPVILDSHLNATPLDAMPSRPASIRSTGSKEFRSVGRHANLWLFNDYSLTGGAKKMYKFLAGGRGRGSE